MNDIGILALSQALPETTSSLDEIARQEGAVLSSRDAGELGIERVHVCSAETGSLLAMKAARKVLDISGIEAEQIDIIVDYSIMPQEYLVPAWNMSNKVQHEIGAKKSFTIGFSGAGSTNVLVALDFAYAALRTDVSVDYILLLGADTAIPGNRMLNRDEPLTVLGDGASALLVGRSAKRNRIRATKLATHGHYHDVCFIQGGGMMYPTRTDLYRMEIDSAKYHSARKYDTPTRQVEELLREEGMGRPDIRQVVCQNISASDGRTTASALGFDNGTVWQSALRDHGHVQANDLVFNLIGLVKSRALKPGDPYLLCSHGMGFTSGVMLFEY